jgi:hypothetical protein
VFRAKDLAHASTVFFEQAKPSFQAPNLTTAVLVVMGLAVAGHLLTHRAYDRMARRFAALPVPLRAAGLIAVALVVKAVATTEAQPFIYFRF